MALRFIGIDPDTGGGNCPAVWVDTTNQEILVQGWRPDPATEAECANDSPRPETETIVRVPVRMAEIIRKALDEAEGP
jgi:hypothetical protein